MADQLTEEQIAEFKVSQISIFFLFLSLTRTQFDFLALALSLSLSPLYKFSIYPSHILLPFISHKHTHTQTTGW